MKQDTNNQKNHQVPWNKGKLIGQKSPLKLKEIWEIRIRLQMAKNTRELALFNLAIDSKLRGCDLVTLGISDVAQSNRVSSRAIIMQQKTHRPVQFEITEQTEIRLRLGSTKLSSNLINICSRVEFIILLIYQPGNMLVLSNTG